MPQARQDLSRSVPVPWKSYLLGALGAGILATASEPIVKLVGLAAVAGGALWLAFEARTARRLIDRILQAIPIQDKSEAVLQELPKAWSALEYENQTLKAQAHREDRLRISILANLRAGLIIFGADRRVRMFNPAAQRLLGSSSCLGLDESLPGVFREPESLRNLERAFQGESVEWVLRRTPRVLSLRAVPMLDPSGEDGDLLVTLDDISRQEALENTRQKFISNASHELKTPTTSLRIAAENLQDGNHVLPGGESSLQSIFRSVDRMTMLLNDISELSRIETGALVLRPEPIQLGDFVSGLLEDLRPQAKAQQVALACKLPPALEARCIHADPLRLQQLLENLLSNAIKFSPQNAEVRLSIQPDGPWLAWTVEDHGPGIAPTEAQRIFERFYRSPSARGIPGTGLGLSIVKHLSAQMGGEIALESELGKGAKFTLRLPFAETGTHPHEVHAQS